LAGGGQPHVVARRHADVESQEGLRHAEVMTLFWGASWYQQQYEQLF